MLAGDSAGAQIAAEVANAITSPAHAQRIGLVPALQPDRLAGMLASQIRVCRADPIMPKYRTSDF